MVWVGPDLSHSFLQATFNEAGSNSEARFQSLEERASWMIYLGVDARLDAGGDSRFDELQRRMGLEKR
jgi:hypothetical protein